MNKMKINVKVIELPIKKYDSIVICFVLNLQY